MLEITWLGHATFQFRLDTGEVFVMGSDDHLEVWNNENIRRSLKEEPLTESDWSRLANQGI